MRRFNRSRRTRRTSRHRQSFQVERDDQRLAFDALKTDVGRIGHTGCVFSVQAGGFRLEQFPFQFIAESRYLLIFAASETGNRQLGGLS